MCEVVVSLESRVEVDKGGDLSVGVGFCLNDLLESK